MPLPAHKTKIVCTIGPASREPETLERMVRAGMRVARLNFSHGSFDEHAEVIQRVRSAAASVGCEVAVMADLPGPKIRIGELAEEPIELAVDDEIRLTTDDIVGSRDRMSVTFERLPDAVKPEDRLFLNDGMIHLAVQRVEANDVVCRVLVGGELRSRKGLNLPGIDLGISAFTDRDRECLAFAVEHRVDAVSQSFVERAADLRAVREAAAVLGASPFVVAKIERRGALDRLDEILDAADGIMVARGDLGVEIPIERIAVIQKDIMLRARLRGTPVITATHMLESMCTHRRPTRAEATDVANAILDGTDCVMLSGESAMGRYPVESVEMLAAIAAATEPHHDHGKLGDHLAERAVEGVCDPVDLIALSVYHTSECAPPAALIVPTRSGATARNVTRFRLPEWIVAVSPFEATCRHLQFSYGVHAKQEVSKPEDWHAFARECVHASDAAGSYVLLTEGPSEVNPTANHRMEIVTL